jgi:hypothetical protein
LLALSIRKHKALAKKSCENETDIIFLIKKFQIKKTNHEITVWVLGAE